MCGRYSLEPGEFSQIRLPFDLSGLLGLPPRYNIAPSYASGHEPPLLRVTADAAVHVRFARWWFIPPGWKQPLAQLPTSFNARSEDLERKPLWKSSFRSRRCLVPASGWREFSGQRGHKRAFQFHLGAPCMLAGLWSRWVTADGEVVDSFAIITAAAAGVAARIHPRMPVALAPALWEDWLTRDDQRQGVLQQSIDAQPERMQVFEVSNHGNSPQAEGPECVAPLHGEQADPALPAASETRQLKLF